MNFSLSAWLCCVLRRFALCAGLLPGLSYAHAQPRCCRRRKFPLLRCTCLIMARTYLSLPYLLLLLFRHHYAALPALPYANFTTAAAAHLRLPHHAYHLWFNLSPPFKLQPTTGRAFACVAVGCVATQYPLQERTHRCRMPAPRVSPLRRQPSPCLPHTPQAPRLLQHDWEDWTAGRSRCILPFIAACLQRRCAFRPTRLFSTTLRFLLVYHTFCAHRCAPPHVIAHAGNIALTFTISTNNDIFAARCHLPPRSRNASRTALRTRARTARAAPLRCAARTHSTAPRRYLPYLTRFTIQTHLLHTRSRTHTCAHTCTLHAARARTADAPASAAPTAPRVYLSCTSPPAAFYTARCGYLFATQSGPTPDSLFCLAPGAPHAAIVLYLLILRHRHILLLLMGVYTPRSLYCSAP